MTDNFIKLNSYIPFTSLYAYIDTYETTEQTINMLRDAGLRPLSKGFFSKDGKPWTIRICRILTKNENKLETIFRRMRFMYGELYENCCDDFKNILKEVGITI